MKDKVYVVTDGADAVDTAVLRVFKTLDNARGYIKSCIKEDIEKDGYEEEEYQSTMEDLFLEKYVLVREVDGYEEELWYEVWEEELL